jgi:hypothetical protein
MCTDGFQNIVMSTMWALGSRIQLMACSRQCWFARLPSPSPDPRRLLFAPLPARPTVLPRKPPKHSRQ